MSIKDAIKIAHIRHHLTAKGKHPEYYIELDSLAKAIEMGIEALRKDDNDGN